MRNDLLEQIVHGDGNNLPDHIRKKLDKDLQRISNNFQKIKDNDTTIKLKSIKGAPYGNVKKADSFDGYTNLVNLFDDANKTNSSEYVDLLGSIATKNKRYFSILKDYEMMPILIPQINRILKFLVNECVSPDIKNPYSFNIKVKTSIGDKVNNLETEIENIRKEYDLDRLLYKVYNNRFKLGRDYYTVADYKKSFDLFKNKLQTQPINENTNNRMSEFEYLDSILTPLKGIIGKDTSGNLITESFTVINENTHKEVNIDYSLADLNIEYHRTPLIEHLDELKVDYLEETSSKYSMDSILTGSILNEGVISKDKADTLMEYLSKKTIDKCSVKRLDPSKIFKIAPGGKTIGYFYINEITEKNLDVTLSQTLRERLVKNKAGKHTKEEENVEKKIVTALAEKIINTFDVSSGINRMEDIDLLHDFIFTNKLLEGNKRIVFFYKDDLFDLSREDESLLINAVFFTKLYATLLLNNITTKVLRGRSRFIHKVNTGVSESHRRYVENAVASLTMPETRLGTITGSFEHLLNPFYSASDIVIPVIDMGDPVISTDIIDGINIDMDNDMLRFLLNSIVLSFDLDSAVIDTTNGNIDFAKTLTMISLQIANSVRSEQADNLPNWTEMVLEVLKICGTDSLKAAIDSGDIEISFYSPKTIVLAMSIEELNNARQYAETIADSIPAFQGSDDDVNINRALFIYKIIKREANLNWSDIEEILDDLDIDLTSNKLKEDIKAKIKEKIEKNKEVDVDGASEENTDTPEDIENDDLDYDEEI